MLTILPMPETQQRHISASACMDPETIRLQQQLKDAFSKATECYNRKAFEAALPHFRMAVHSAYKLGNFSMEFSCLNNLISSIRMSGLTGEKEPEAESLIERALDMIAMSEETDVVNCINAYINIGSIYILKQQWQQAIRFFSHGEEVLQRAHANGYLVDQSMDATVLQCNAQAFLGMIGSAQADEIPSNQSCLKDEIISRLVQILSMKKASKERKAAAHRTLAYYFETCADPPDYEAMGMHRAEAFKVLELPPPSQCLICSEDICLQDPGLVTLGCFHIYHRKCYRKWEDVRCSSGLCPECPLCRFRGH